MTNNDLEIVLKSDEKEIKYKYLANKKKKFFLQYNNSKKIDNLEKYILANGIIEYNFSWAHSFEIIYGNDIFKKMYSNILKIEKELLTEVYFKKQLELFTKEIELIDLNTNENNIAIIKKIYQCKVFSLFYKYHNIVRLYYINKGYNIELLKLYELYDIIDIEYKKIFEHIFIYIWELKKISRYCNMNNISYSIHVDNIINNYNLVNLRELFILIKNEILNSLKEMEEGYGK